MFIDPTSSTLAHRQFIAWLNAKEALPENTTFYKNLFVSIWNNLPSLSTYVYIQELYKTNGSEYNGFLVITDIDNVSRKMYLFDSDGLPTHYNITDVDNIVGIGDNGVIESFTSGNVVALYDSSDVHTKNITISYQVLFGNRFPFFLIYNTTGGYTHKGLFDADYDARLSSSYTVYLDTSDEIEKYEVFNLTNQKLRIDMQITSDFSFPYEIEANGSIFVPKTPHTLSFLNKAKDNGSLKYI